MHAGTLPLCHNIEVKILDEHAANLVTVIAVSNVDLFGTQLVQNGFLTQLQLSDISSTLGVKNSAKSQELLQIVSTRIQTATKKEMAQDNFNKLLHILVHLGLQDQAEVLAAKLSKCNRMSSL